MAATKNSAPKTSGLRSSTISIVVSITLVLFMLGLLGLLVIQGQRISNYVRENLQLTIFLKEDAPQQDIDIFLRYLNASAYIKSTEFISKENAADRLKEDLGEDFVQFLGYNPLSASVDVKLKAEYTHPDSIASIETKIKKSPVVLEVHYQQSLVNAISKNIRSLALLILVFCGLLALIAIVLINSTIRLALYSQRFIIRSMQLVGATPSFIRQPFLKSAIVNGLISGLASLALLAGLMNFAYRQVPELAEFGYDLPWIGILFLTVFSIGIAISYISTRLALSRYLRMTTDELYYK